MRSIGAYAIMTLLGKNPNQTKKALWLYLLNKVDGVAESSAMEWGKRLEPVVRQKFKENNKGMSVISQDALDKLDGSELFNESGISLVCTENLNLVRHEKYPFIVGAIDGLIIDRNCTKVISGLECKALDKFGAMEYGDSGTDEIPENVLIQANHYAGLCGCDYWYVAALIGGNDYREYCIDFDEELYEEGIERAVKFWETYVATKQEPPDDGPSKVVRAWLAEEFPDNGQNTRPATDQEQVYADALAMAYARKKEADFDYADMQQKLLTSIGDGKTIVTLTSRLSVTRSQRNTTDYKAICQELLALAELKAVPAELIAKHTKEGKPFSFIRVPADWSKLAKKTLPDDFE